MPDLFADGGELLAKTIVSLRVDEELGPQLSDEEREDLAASSYERVLEAYRKGRTYDSYLAVVKKTARNLAIDYLRHRSFQGDGEPNDETFVRRSGDLNPEATLLNKLDLVGGIEAAEQLPPEQARVFRAVVIDELSTTEALDALAMPRSTFFKYKRLAFDHVMAAQLEGEDSPVVRARIKLLTAYAFGLADERERARAERLLKEDPTARPQLVAIRRAHEIAAVGLPALALQEVAGEATPGLLDRVAAVPGKIRDAVYGFVRPETAEAASGPLGTAFGGTTGQLAAVCGGVATVACVAAVAPGVGVRAVGHEEEKPPAIERSAKAKKQRGPLAVTPAPTIYPSQVGNEAPVPVAAEPAPATEPTQRSGEDQDPESTTSSEPVPVEEAPSSDFSFAAESSSPAPAPTSTSSGSSSGGGGGGSSGGSGGTEGGDFAFGQ